MSKSSGNVVDILTTENGKVGNRRPADSKANEGIAAVSVENIATIPSRKQFPASDLSHGLSAAGVPATFLKDTGNLGPAIAFADIYAARLQSRKLPIDLSPTPN
ncbi:hypothetical protein KDL45_11100 [bacterium]|nr:hypothetical protein [bacterium]